MDFLPSKIICLHENLNLSVVNLSLWFDADRLAFFNLKMYQNKRNAQTFARNFPEEAKRCSMCTFMPFLQCNRVAANRLFL